MKIFLYFFILVSLGSCSFSFSNDSVLVVKENVKIHESTGITNSIITKKVSPVSETKSGIILSPEQQKKKQQFAVSLLEIPDKQYLQLHMKQLDILSGKEIWTEELIAIDKEFTKLMSVTTNSGEVNKNLSDIINKRNLMLDGFKESDIFKKYIQSHQQELSDLDIELHKYWTPEMVTLDKEIKQFNGEIHKN